MGCSAASSSRNSFGSGRFFLGSEQTLLLVCFFTGDDGSSASDERSLWNLSKLQESLVASWWIVSFTGTFTCVSSVVSTTDEGGNADDVEVDGLKLVSSTMGVDSTSQHDDRSNSSQRISSS